MTRDEIIDGLERHTVGRIKEERVFITVGELQQYIDAIKALEQESILNKIRAEVDGLDVLRFSSGERIYKDEVLDIIDKYKGKSEE